MKEISAWISAKGPIDWASEQMSITFLGNSAQKKARATGMAFYASSSILASDSPEMVKWDAIIDGDTIGNDTSSFSYAKGAANRSANPAAWLHDCPFVVEIEPRTFDGALNTSNGRELYVYSAVHPKTIRRLAVGYSDQTSPNKKKWYEFDIKRKDERGLPIQIDLRRLAPMRHRETREVLWQEGEILWSSASNTVPTLSAISQTELLPAVKLAYEYLSLQ